ncbi:MAG TPA: MurR/RpiR family transcriptional regulator [Rhizobiaceae bacterium]|nr:MurR/RpiR family transcriptional regulator [Rhizobiaceae bacterium]
MNVEPQLPRDYDSLRALVLEQRGELPKRLAQVAAYALDNPDEIAFGTAASIAASAGVQPSTLIRFAQHLGYDGFTSLQSVFRQRLRGRTLSYEERLTALRQGPHEGPESRTVLNGFVSASQKSLDAILHSMSDRLLEEAVSVLAKAETIYVLARRRSYPVASYMAYAFGKLKIRSQIIESAAGLDPEILSFATPRDAVVAVSFSPYATGTIDAARTLAEQGVPVVAITDSAFSPLAQTAKIWFEVAEADCAGFRSLSATMALAMTLTVAVAERRRDA